jgi:hypothetical protein
MTFMEFLFSAIGATIAFSIYKLNIQLRRDSWARTLREVHQFFWTDPYCEEVRAWIANDEAYEKVRPILKKRAKTKNQFQKTNIRCLKNRQILCIARSI